HAPAITGPAEMTLLPAEVVLGDYRKSGIGDEPLPAELLQQDLTSSCLGRVELPGPLELSVRKMREIFLPSLDANEFLDVAPPRRQILVANRPIDAVSLARVRLKIEIAPAVHAATPHDRSAADLTTAYPVERLSIRR